MSEPARYDIIPTVRVKSHKQIKGYKDYLSCVSNVTDGAGGWTTTYIYAAPESVARELLAKGAIKE